MIVDPVCKKEVDEKTASGGKARFWKGVFYFCSKSCRAAFQREPQKFLPEETVGDKGPDDPGGSLRKLFRLP